MTTPTILQVKAALKIVQNNHRAAWVVLKQHIDHLTVEAKVVEILIAGGIITEEKAQQAREIVNNLRESKV